MSTAATQKLLDGTLAELSDIETHEVSLVPLGANGLPLLAVKGISGEYTTPKIAAAPEEDAEDDEPEAESDLTLTAATKADLVTKLARFKTALSLLEREVASAQVGATDSPEIGAAMVKLGKALAPTQEPEPASDMLVQLANKLLAQPRASAEDTETAVLMQRAADRIAQQQTQITKLLRDLERASSRLPPPAADPHVDEHAPTRKSTPFPVHWKAGKPCGLSDSED
jgi:hypothetical protein